MNNKPDNNKKVTSTEQRSVLFLSEKKDIFISRL